MKPKFTPDRFDGDGYALLMAAARLTLRLALIDPNSEIDHLTDSFNLFDRIQNLMNAYIHSEDGKVDADNPSAMLISFANAVAITIAQSPSLRAALAAHLATDNDP
jgi:hypothetical protein